MTAKRKYITLTVKEKIAVIDKLKQQKCTLQKLQLHPVIEIKTIWYGNKTIQMVNGLPCSQAKTTGSRKSKTQGLLKIKIKLWSIHL